MGCKPNLDRHCRVVAALTPTLGINGPRGFTQTESERNSLMITAYVINIRVCVWNVGETNIYTEHCWPLFYLSFNLRSFQGRFNLNRNQEINSKTTVSVVYEAVRARSHQRKAESKAGKSKNERQTSKKFFAFTFTFSWFEHSLMSFVSNVAFCGGFRSVWMSLAGPFTATESGSERENVL